MDLRHRRIDYDSSSLGDDVPADPFTLFGTWLHDATAAEAAGTLFEATAMTLSTATQRSDGAWQPASRVVLLKSWDPSGFVFFTHHTSAKGRAIAANPQVSLHFHWDALHRQVRIEGPATTVPRAESEEYFAMRPRASQVGAWASRQSEPVESREAMLAAYDDAERRFDGETVPCPPQWGGYRVAPERVEFWQGRPSRFHDRIVYQASADGWTHRRLNP